MFFFSFAEFMDALTAPRANKKVETNSQTKIRGLGIEENSSCKSTVESAPSLSSQEAIKPRGKANISTTLWRLCRITKLREASQVKIPYFYCFRGNEIRANNNRCR